MTQHAADRRRIYLMRHGSVDYFHADGTIAHPESVPLNAQGQAQAQAAGELFRASAVRFDRVVASGLPRTVETATRVLEAAGQPMPIGVDAALQEIRGGRLADIAGDQIEHAFLGAFRGGVDIESVRFLGGESIGEMLDRVLPAFEHLLRSDDWRCLLLVLHGGVNRALLARALTGTRAFFGRFEQAAGCINVLDADGEDLVVRAVNLAASQWLQEHETLTTMEKLLQQYQRLRRMDRRR